MLPLSRRGNAPQTLCHRPFPSIILPRYLIFYKTFFRKIFSIFHFVSCSFQRLLLSLQMLSAHRGCDVLKRGWGRRVEHYIVEKRHCTLCFWQLERRKFNSCSKTTAEVTPTDVYYIRSRSVPRGIVPSRTLLGALYIYAWGYQICSFFQEGLPTA